MRDCLHDNMLFASYFSFYSMQFFYLEKNNTIPIGNSFQESNEYRIKSKKTELNTGKHTFL